MTTEQAAQPGRDHALQVLVCAASKHQATAEIAEAIGQVLARHGYATTVIPPEQVDTVQGYDAVILGSAVYAGHWLDPAKELVSRSRDGLATRPVWLFSSGPVGDPSSKLVQKMGEDPLDVAEILRVTNARGHRVFAGRLERKHLSLPQRAVLMAFHGLEGDFRDWAKIQAWAEEIAQELARLQAGQPKTAPTR
jgi:menaquinone-dependent protoporphyrinogen oxidase